MPLFLILLLGGDVVVEGVHRETVGLVRGRHGISAPQTNVDKEGLNLDQERKYFLRLAEEHNALNFTKRGSVTQPNHLTAYLVRGLSGALAQPLVECQEYKPVSVTEQLWSNAVEHVHLLCRKHDPAQKSVV